MLPWACRSPEALPASPHHSVMMTAGRHPGQTPRCHGHAGNPRPRGSASLRQPLRPLSAVTRNTQELSFGF